jgi:acyl dehydratase
MSKEQALAQVTALVGKEVHVSDWLDVSQDRINRFAESTGDHQWIHVDVERARRESPWKSTIAHGYLTVSLYPLLRGLVVEGKPLYAGQKQVINYGINKLRFVNAVKSGARIRLRCTLLEIEEVKGGFQFTEQATIEIEGETRPACVADVVMRVLF